jgi:hypothetical protein
MTVVLPAALANGPKLLLVEHVTSVALTTCMLVTGPSALEAVIATPYTCNVSGEVTPWLTLNGVVSAAARVDVITVGVGP